MTHGLDTSVVVRIISGLPEGAAGKVGQRIAADIADGDVFTVSALVLKDMYVDAIAAERSEGIAEAQAECRADGRWCRSWRCWTGW